VFCSITSYPVPYPSPDSTSRPGRRSPGSVSCFPPHPYLWSSARFITQPLATLRPTTPEHPSAFRVRFRFPQICVPLLSGLFRPIAERITLHTISHAARIRFTVDCAHQKDTKSYRPRRSRHSKTGQDNSTPAYTRRKHNSFDAIQRISRQGQTRAL